MYKDIFAIDEASFQERKIKNEIAPSFFLNNFNSYCPALEKDFYLRYFIRELLFEVEITEVHEFLEVHFENTKNKVKLAKVIKYKIVPAIDRIVRKANYSQSSNQYFDEIPLEDGFVSTEGVVKNSLYEFDTFYHLTHVNDLKEDLFERKAMILDYLNPEILTKKDKLIWSGKPTHLAFIIGELVENGYIMPPLNKNGDTNFTHLAKQILESFDFKPEIKIPTVDSIRKCANRSEYQGESLLNSFEKNDYSLPHSNRF